jgi:hypothetical protein
MNNDSEYIVAINNLIQETEGKLQTEMKDNKYGNGVENLKTVLKYLREKHKELKDDQKKTKNKIIKYTHQKKQTKHLV